MVVRRCLLGVLNVLVLVSLAECAPVEGVSGFQKVNEQLYRGSQPHDVGSLARAGIKTVVDLRPMSDATRKEKAAVEASGMRYVNVPMQPYSAPTNEQVSRVLALLDPAAKSDGPVFVHCRRGKDRTGLVIACYRVMYDHWSNAKALEEAKAAGMSRLETAMRRYVLAFRPPGNGAQ